MIRPLGPFTVRPVRRDTTRRTVSAAAIAEIAATGLNAITPARRAVRPASQPLVPKLRIIGRKPD